MGELSREGRVPHSRFRGSRREGASEAGTSDRCLDQRANLVRGDRPGGACPAWECFLGSRPDPSGLDLDEAVNGGGQGVLLTRGDPQFSVLVGTDDLDVVGRYRCIGDSERGDEAHEATVGIGGMPLRGDLFGIGAVKDWVEDRLLWQTRGKGPPVELSDEREFVQADGSV